MMGRMKPGTNIFLEYLGWCGAVAVLAAYTLYFLGRLDADSIWFQVLNLVGGIGIVAVSLYRKVWQAAIVGAIWASIAAYALYIYLLAA